MTTAAYYPGHLGPQTVVRFRDQHRHAEFAAGQIRELPEAEVRDLVRWGGFLEALDLDLAADLLGISRQDLRTLIRRGEIRTARLRRQDGSTDEFVLRDAAFAHAISHGPILADADADETDDSTESAVDGEN